MYANLTLSRYLLTSLQYLSSATLIAGVKAGELHQGHFNANQYNYLEVRFGIICYWRPRITIKQGSVSVTAFAKPVLLVGRENMNRAVQGDVVVVQVFEEKEWKAPADEVVDQESRPSPRSSNALHLTHLKYSYAQK